MTEAAGRRAVPRAADLLVNVLALVAGAVAAVVGAYLAAAAAGSLFVHGGPRPGDGPLLRRIYVYASPIHVDVVLPVADDVADWRPLILSAAFPGDAEARRALATTASHVAFGRGAASFYFNVRTFDTLRPLALLDSIWDDGIVHATAVVAPDGIAGMIPLDVSDAGYRRLVARLTTTLGETPTPVAAQSYGDRDGFFAAAEDYSLLSTCNVWAAELLRAAGVSMPAWSPLPQPVRDAALRAASR